MEGHVLGARIQIPGIKVLRLIGEGGMSRVYLASRDKRRRAAGGEDPAQRSHRRTSARWRASSRSTTWSSASAAGTWRASTATACPEGNAYLVMEFFDGGDLNKRLGDKALPPEEALQHLPRADVRAGRHPRAGHPAPRPEAAEPDVPRRRQPGDRRFRHRQARRFHRPHQPGRDPRHAALHEPGAGAGQGARPAHRHLQRGRAAVPDDAPAAPVRAARPRSRWRCTT